MGLFKMTYSVQQIAGELNLNGSDSTVTVSSRYPRCDDWGKLELLSYYYLRINCFGVVDCQTPLSPAAEMELHRMCSMKEACTSSIFHSVDSVDPKSYKLVVHYQCLDHFVTFIDICTNTTKTDDKDVHLISSDSLRSSKQCQCSIKGGGFSFLLNDIRLTSMSSNSEKNCAPVTLKILSLEYPCNSEQGVFNTQLDAASAMANVSLRSTSRDVLPEMIWITVQPKETFTITCASISWDTLENPTTVGLTIRPFSDPVNRTDSDSTSNSSTLTNTVIGVVGFVVVIGLIVVIIVCWERKRREARPTKSKPDNMEMKRGKHGKKDRTIKGSETEPLEEHKTSEIKYEKDTQKPKLNLKANTYSEIESHPPTLDKALVNENAQTEFMYTG